MIDTLESLSTATAGPAPTGDTVATVYKDSSGSALYVEPLPPQSLTCLGPVPMGAVGCPVDRVWYGFAKITPQQQADAEWLYRSPDLDRNWVLVVGHLATVTVRDHRTGAYPIEQTWFMVNKLYLTPFRGRVIERHSTQFFYATGTTSNAQVLAISHGEQSPRAAHITLDRHGHVWGQQRPEQRRRHVRDRGGRLHALSLAHPGRRVFRPTGPLTRLRSLAYLRSRMGQIRFTKRTRSAPPSTSAGYQAQTLCLV